MPYVYQVPPEKAQGSLQHEYEAAMQRAGRIWNIVSVQSQNPVTLRASMRLYSAAMHGESGLSRATREMLAVVVSRVNECVY